MRLIRLTVVLALAFTLAPVAAAAQTAGKVYRIGLLLPATADSSSPLLAALRQGLRELGDVEGQNVALERRYADGRPERLPGLAAELVRLKVDVIVATSNPAIAAARNVTTSIPIVMTVASDPVASGFVTSLARPGGNITGLTTQTPDLAGKRLQLLKETIPNLSRVAVLSDPGFLDGRQNLSETQAAAPAVGVQLQLVEVRSPDELDGAFAAVNRGRAGATVILGSPMLFVHRARIVELAIKRRLPTMCGVREYVEAGCLIGYGTGFTDQLRRAAYFVDKILKGAHPAELPVEQPTKFELVINLKTAKALGVTIPQSLLIRADEIIQ